MDLSRRTFLKGSLGITGVMGPFNLGYGLGRSDSELSSEEITEAVSQARIRLEGSGPKSTSPDSTPPSEAAAGTSDTQTCDVDIERTTISPASVDQALRDLDEDRSIEYYRYRLDNELRTTDRETVSTLLKCDRTDWNEYTDDFYDCEEFAMDLRMNFVNKWDLNNVGIVYDESASPVPHVYNIVFYDDATFDLIEPQTDKVVSPGDDERYTFRDVAILL